MFAILFTVGTSYFIFEDQQNASYVSSLLQATNKVQSGIHESLSITSALETDGDVGFTATDTSSVSVNMTAVLVISSTGSLLKCAGVGFPSGAGCSNTTPSLWIVLNAGSTSSSIDTGSTYTPGSTVTIKVLTARGNTYSTTYPSPASQSTSSQAVTVSLDNLKWVQLLPEASSLAHTPSVSTCASTSCTVTDSSPTAGNILVDGFGWGGQSPPNGFAPSDTLHSTWNAGPQESVIAPNTPSVASTNSKSSCTAGSCGLQLSSTAAGDVLVYAADWANQSPPSAPSDTFGDSFTVAEGDQLTVNPPTPQLIQSFYQKNCGVATCGATTSNNVNTGDTLVFGLGWVGNLPYVPITVTNCQSPVPFGLDGDNSNSGEGSTLSASLTTTHTNDVIIVIVYGQDNNRGTYQTVSSVTDSANSLTFTERGTYQEQYNAGGYSSFTGIWYATASSTLSADSIKVTWNSSPTLYGWIQVFGVSGANTASPFDSHSGLPAPATAGNYASVSTSNAIDFIYGLENTDTTNAPTVGSGFSAIESGVTNSYTGAEYELVSSTQSSLSMSYSNAASDSNMAWGDAIVRGTTACSSSSALALDGSTGGESETNTATASLTTSNPDDVIILSAGTSSYTASVSSVSDTTGLAWHQRAVETGNPSVEMEEWYAIAPSALSSDTITVKWSAAGDDTFEAFGISGADVAAPFDTNSGLADKNTGTTTTPSVTVSTSNANDFIYGLLANEHTSAATCHTETDGSGFTDTGPTQCALGSNTSQNSDQEYEIVSSTQTNLSIPFTTSTGGSNQWAMIGDAVQAAPATSTPTTFQEMITWDPATYTSSEASNLGNIRFCTSNLCTTELYAWLESCLSPTSCSNTSTSATAWVKLTSAISSGSSTTIYMVFEPTTTNYDDNYWGEAPTISVAQGGTYAQYDNGANVFTFYDNFAGSTLDSNWQTVLYGTGGSVSVNNGVTLSETATTGNPILVSKSTYSPAVEDASLALTSKQTAASTPTIFYATTLPTTSGGDYGYQTNYRFDWDDQSSLFRIIEDSGGTNGASTTLSYTLPSTYNVWSGTWSATGAEQLSFNYVPQITWTNTGVTYGSAYIGASTVQGGSTTVQWLRLRAVPPNGIMPSAVFGTLVSGNGSPSTPTDSWSDTFSTSANLENSITLSGITYYSEIWYAVASNAPGNAQDTITATFPAAVVGSVSIYEIAGYTTTGLQTPTASSSSSSATTGVTSFTPAAGSFVIGDVETASGSSTFTAGSGPGTGAYTLIPQNGDGNCASGGVYGCSEYENNVQSSSTTIATTLGTAAGWVETGIAFPQATANTYYSYIWYGTVGTGHSGLDTISATFSVNTGFVSDYAIANVLYPYYAVSDCTSASSSCTSGPQVNPSMTPSSPGNSVVIGSVMGSASSTYTVGSGYTLTGTCSSTIGCAEYDQSETSTTNVPMSISPSVSWVESSLDLSPITVTYYSYIWYATLPSGGSSDTVTLGTFSGNVVGGVDSLYEITGYTTSGALSAVCNSTAGCTTASVHAYTPATDSFIVGNVEGASSANDFTPGTGFTLVSTSGSVNCSSTGLNGCSEYDSSNSDGGSSNTVPMTLSVSSTPWAESSMSFSTPFNPQSGIQVGGYPTLGVPSGADIAWEVTFTNVDPLQRSLTLWPQSELAIGSAEYDGFDTDYTQAHYYIIGSLNPGSTTINPYTTGGFVTLQYDVPTTLYFAATQPLGSTTQAFGTNVLTPFEAYFALDGTLSDGTLFGETIPYPYGIITEANAYTTPTADPPSQTVTVSCTTPCDFSDSTGAFVGWINSAGQLTQLTTFTTTSSGGIPSGVTFTVPNVSNGYYTICVSDYTNTVFMTFQVT